MSETWNKSFHFLKVKNSRLNIKLCQHLLPITMSLQVIYPFCLVQLGNKSETAPVSRKLSNSTLYH